MSDEYDHSKITVDIDPETLNLTMNGPPLPIEFQQLFGSIIPAKVVGVLSWPGKVIQVTYDMGAGEQMTIDFVPTFKAPGPTN